MFESAASPSFVFEMTSPQHIVPTTMTAAANHQVHFSGAFASPLVGPCSASGPNFVSPHCSVTSGNRSLTSSLSSTASEYSHSKRSRDSSESTLDGDFFDLQQAIPAVCSLPTMTDVRQEDQSSSPTKRNRPNTYIAPRKVPQTFLSAMGSLANNSTRPADSSGFQRVPMRRQLSASKLDPYLSRHSHHGGDNNMMLDDTDMDMEATRPRSMSF